MGAHPGRAEPSADPCGTAGSREIWRTAAPTLSDMKGRLRSGVARGEAPGSGLRCEPGFPVSLLATRRALLHGHGCRSGSRPACTSPGQNFSSPRPPPNVANPVSTRALMAKRLDDGGPETQSLLEGESASSLPGGARVEFEAFYRANFATVDRAVGQILAGADKETVVHEIFLRLMTNEQLRLRFRGGSLTAWLSTVARNHAIDYLRRRRFEQPSEVSDEFAEGHEDADQFERRAEARILVERFRREHLPEKWARVFELRFLQQLEQEQAARQLGMHRTTLAYQEYRIRALLRRFLLKLENE